MSQFVGLAFARSALIDLPNQKELTSFAQTFMVTHQDLFKKYDPMIEQRTIDIDILVEEMTKALKENFDSTYFAEAVDSRTGDAADYDTPYVSLCIRAECRFSSLVH